MPDPSLPYVIELTPEAEPNFTRTFTDHFGRPLNGTVELTALGVFPASLPVDLDSVGRMSVALRPGDYKLVGRLTTTEGEVVYVLDTISIRS